MVYNISRLPRLGPADVHGTSEKKNEVWSSASTQQAKDEAVVSMAVDLYRNIYVLYVWHLLLVCVYVYTYLT